MSDQLSTACAAADRYLVDLAFGEEAGVPASARTHVQGCTRCQTALRELEETRALAGALPLEEPSDALDRNVLAALDAHLAGESLDRFETQPAPAEIPRPALRLAASAPASAAPRKRRSAGWILGGLSTAALAAGVAFVTFNGPDFSTHASAPAPAAEAPQSAKIAPAPVAAVVVPAQPLADEAGAKDQAPEGARAQPLADAKVAPAESKAKAEAAPEPAKRRALRQFGTSGFADDLAAPAAEAAPAPASAPAQAPAPKAERKEAEARQLAADAPAFGAGGELGSGAVNGFGSLGPSAAASAGGLREKSASAKLDSLEKKPVASAQAANRALSFDVQPRGSASALPPPPTSPLSMPAPSRAPAPVAMAEPAAPAAKKASSTLVWQVPLAQARAAAARGDWTDASTFYKHVLNLEDLPDDVTQEALGGRADALVQLGRIDEAERVADELARRYPGHDEARLKVIRARQRSEERPAPATTSTPR